MMTRSQLYDELEKRGIDYEDVDFVIDEAERRKLICLDYNALNIYYWIPPEKREEEKRKTERLEKTVESVFLEKAVERLPEEELRKSLANKGLSELDVERAVLEAERDCIISCDMETCRILPLEDRERMPEIKRWRRFVSNRWLEEKMLYEAIWEKEEEKERRQEARSSARRKSKKKKKSGKN
ncbi:MAG: hypothetical protein QXU11_06895 [Thermoproteota archaeon]